jgi:glycosyltransferase involved in cell wall biosynthesis
MGWTDVAYRTAMGPLAGTLASHRSHREHLVVQACGYSASVPAPPLITVVMPHRGCETYLFKAAQSILEQTVADVRLIIVDDASETCEWLHTVRPLVSDPRVELLQSNLRVGPYRILNAVIPALTSPFVAFQDADDVSAPTRLERQLSLLAASRADIVGCSFMCVDADGHAVRAWKMRRFANLWHELGRNFLAHHPTTLVRREVFDVLGGYDGTTYFGADSDFMTRAAYLFRIRNCRSILYEYRQRVGSLTASPSTGFGSPARRRYRQELADRKQRWSRIRDRESLRAALRALPNDISFELNAVTASSAPASGGAPTAGAHGAGPAVSVSPSVAGS